VIRYRCREQTREGLAEAFGRLDLEAVRQWCFLSQGALAAVPLLFGRPAARVTQSTCEGLGEEWCEVVVEWSPASLWQRLRASLRGLSRKQRALLSRVGQMEALTRDRTAALGAALEQALRQEERAAEARAQLATAKAFAAGSAHDINNALGPARSAIEELIGVLAETGASLPRADDEVARSVSAALEDRLGRVVASFEKIAGQLPREKADSVLGTLEYLARLTATLRGAVPDLYRGINRASDFTAFMTEVAHADYARERAPVDLSRLLAELVDHYRGVWESEAVEFDPSLQAGVSVTGWPQVFESIFGNLLDNAARAVEGSPEKRVAVRLETEGGRAVATVSDTGPGVPEELRERVFDLGFTTRPAAGKGFGLSYARNYALLLGGRIALETEDGPGATFRLSFPLAGAEQAPGEELAGTEEQDQ
jgi:signal transduction histidine kinase